MRQVYKTKDGQIFELRQDAYDHEDRLFEQWLANQPSINVNNLFATLDRTKRTEYVATPHGVLRSLLREYFVKQR